MFKGPGVVRQVGVSDMSRCRLVMLDQEQEESCS